MLKLNSSFKRDHSPASYQQVLALSHKACLVNFVTNIGYSHTHLRIIWTTVAQNVENKRILNSPGAPLALQKHTNPVSGTQTEDVKRR